ncbi:hypothetical protein CHUAL_005134 [Chamberlinius hualienensis]
MLNLIAIVALTLFNYGEAQNLKSCSSLPKIEIPNIIEPFVKGSPYNYLFGTPMFECTAILYTYPRDNATDYNAFGLLVKGTTGNALRIKIADDKSKVFVTQCNDGQRFEWTLSKTFVAEPAVGYCFYGCEGDTIKDFGCATNNVTAFYKEMKDYINEIRDVRGAAAIKESKKSCYDGETCPVFY